MNDTNQYQNFFMDSIINTIFWAWKLLWKMRTYDPITNFFKKKIKSNKILLSGVTWITEPNITWLNDTNQYLNHKRLNIWILSLANNV